MNKTEIALILAMFTLPLTIFGIWFYDEKITGVNSFAGKCAAKDGIAIVLRYDKFCVKKEAVLDIN